MTRRSLLGYGAAALAMSNLRRLDAATPESVDKSNDATVIKLPGMDVRLKRPRVIAQCSLGHCWFPDLLRFSTGELMLNYRLNGDSWSNQYNAQAVCLSFDEGQNFDFAYDVEGFHTGGGEARLAMPDGRIVGTSMTFKPEPIGQARRFAAHRWTYDQGGRRYQVEPWGSVFEDIPRDVTPIPKPNRKLWSQIYMFTDIIPFDDGHWLATVSLRYEGENRESTIAVVSEDEGRHWKYLSTIADAQAVSDAQEGFNEPCLVQLADGDLMCVSRVGMFIDQKLARCYSSDGGKTWSPIDRLPAFSVAPQIVRLDRGVLALSTGRPGIQLWLSDDPRGTNWQSIDVVAHHNAHVTPAEAISTEPREKVLDQTTAYTAMVRMPDDRIFLVYDQLPLSWEPIPPDSNLRSGIYLVEIDVQLT